LKKTKIAGFDCAQVLAPLVVGVTGHRDIREEDRKALEDKVRGIFLKLRSDYPATPLILVSALAEGADRLAADVALHAGVRLVVPLPMPIELYETDFDHTSELETPQGPVALTKTSREEFRALLEKADPWFELKLAHGNTYEAIAAQGPARDRQYELVGKYIAQQSQILIALWDGVESHRMGGTASVVHLQTEGVPGPGPVALEPPDGFPVYHILTPRVKNPFPLGEVLSLRAIYPKAFRGNEATAEKYYSQMFARLDEFNRYIADANRDLTEKIRKSKSYLLQNMQEDELPAGMGQALNRYAVADALAIRFQQYRFRGQVWLHGLTFLSFVCLLLFADYPEHWGLSLEFCWILLLGVVLLRTLFGMWAWDAKNEDYRAIAEGLRVKFFWKLAGIKDAVADHYLGKQRSELDWIRNGFRGWNITEDRQDAPDSMEGNEQRNRLAFLRKYWIDDQQSYFRKSAERNLEKQERNERFGRFFIFSAVLLSILFAFPYVRSHEVFLGCVAIAVETLLAAGAILHHFTNRMAYAEHAKQYSRMASLFARASDLLGKCLEREDYKHACTCAREIGNEALAENGEWVLLHRDRPLEVPHP
jgi:hypothetical protein